ncbi:amidase family protein [Candidatus Pristimantibacillus sp. PTI5]|uniref:amidase family protein n=1 Tax=Candidatus Pristimantibacillus sp. PTI5 TaxID=3400422 RepID=UPI003B013D67
MHSAKIRKNRRIPRQLLLILLTFSLLFTIAPAAYAGGVSSPSFDVTEKSITQLQNALDTGQLTSEQLVKLYIDRIKVLDPTFHSIISINPKAEETARSLDAERLAGNKRGSLHGIPIIVKDNYDFEGMPTTAGATALKDSIPPDSARMVQQLTDAGAIIIAKANLSEFAFSGYNSISSMVGETLNVYDPTRSSYGSSGGTGVAISASFAAAGLGTDTGSSIRNPASVSSLVGLRPTIGLTSRDGIVPLILDSDTGGPMTRTVEDLAIMLNYLTGVDPKDNVTSRQAGKVPSDYTPYLDTNFLKGKKIGILKQVVYPTDVEKTRSPHVDSNDPEIIAKFEEAMKDMEAAGAEVVMVDFPEMYDLFSATRGGPNQIPHDIEQYLKSLGPDAPIKSFAELIASGGYLSANSVGLYSDIDATIDPKTSTKLMSDGVTTYREAYAKAQASRVEYRAATEAVMEKYGVMALAYPSLLVKPRLIEDTASHYGSASNLMSPVTGLPAINVPMGHVSDGDGDSLSLGLQMVGYEFDESSLIGAAYAYENLSKNRVTSKYLRATTEIAAFTDVNDNWAVKYISELVASGILKGVSATKFSPNSNISRGMFVTALGRLEKMNIQDGETHFSDVPENAYYASYIKWAANAGIVNGKSDGTFDPNFEISRQDAAVILVRYLKYKGISMTTMTEDIPFSDADQISPYAEEAVNIIQEMGIIDGKQENLFAPGDSILRSEASKIISMAIK